MRLQRQPHSRSRASRKHHHRQCSHHGRGYSSQSLSFKFRTTPVFLWTWFICKFLFLISFTFYSCWRDLKKIALLLFTCGSSTITPQELPCLLLPHSTPALQLRLWQLPEQFCKPPHTHNELLPLNLNLSSPSQPSTSASSSLIRASNKRAVCRPFGPRYGPASQLRAHEWHNHSAQNKMNHAIIFANNQIKTREQSYIPYLVPVNLAITCSLCKLYIVVPQRGIWMSIYHSQTAENCFEHKFWKARMN